MIKEFPVNNQRTNPYKILCDYEDIKTEILIQAAGELKSIEKTKELILFLETNNLDRVTKGETCLEIYGVDYFSGLLCI